MVLLVEKLGRSLKFPSRHENHNLNSDAPLASLRNFRAKISGFISQILSKPDTESKFLSLTGINKCFELIHISNRAFAKLVAEIEYPISRWGAKLTEEYLSYTLNLMDLLNAVSSSVCHLSQAKISTLYALSLIKNSPLSVAKHLKKIPEKNLVKEFKFERPIKIEERTSSDQEPVVLQALILSKKIGLLALGFVVSGLRSDAKPYTEIRKFAGGFDDLLIKDLDLRFCKEVTGTMEELKEVNSATECVSAAISTGAYDEAVEELKRRLKVMENSIQGIEKQSNNLFSEVLGTRNKLLDNIRLSG